MGKGSLIATDNINVFLIILLELKCIILLKPFGHGVCHHGLLIYFIKAFISNLAFKASISLVITHWAIQALKHFETQFFFFFKASLPFKWRSDTFHPGLRLFCLDCFWQNGLLPSLKQLCCAFCYIDHYCGFGSFTYIATHNATHNGIKWYINITTWALSVAFIMWSMKEIAV